MTGPAADSWKGDADDGENRGVGLKRRKEGAQPALFVLARAQAFITPPEIQSKALFTHSAYGVRASCKSFSLSFFLSLDLFLCLSQRLVYMVFSSDGSLLQGLAVTLYTTFLSVALHLLSSFVFPFLQGFLFS